MLSPFDEVIRNLRFHRCSHFRAVANASWIWAIVWPGVMACGKTTLDLRGEEVLAADADVPAPAPVETSPTEAPSPPTQPSESSSPPPSGSNPPPLDPPPPSGSNPPVGREECSSNDTCPLERPMCDPGRGRCVQCFVNSHCPGGEVCNGFTGECMVGCFRNSDCSRLQECDVLQARCVECVTSQHCYFDLFGPEASVCAYNECRSCDAEHPCFGSLTCVEGRCEQLGPPPQPSGPSGSQGPNDRPPPNPAPYGPNPDTPPDETSDVIPHDGPDAGDGGTPFDGADAPDQR